MTEQEQREDRPARPQSCPNCGSKALTAVECLSCGLILAKWDATRTGPVGTKDPLPGVRKGFSRLDKTVSRRWEFVRLAIGVISIVLAWVLYANGKALNAVELYFVVAVYGGTGIWIVATFPNRINARQFLIELCFVGLVSIPAMFVNPMLFGWEDEVDTVMLPMSDLDTPQANNQDDSFPAQLERYLNVVDALLQPDKTLSRSERNLWIKAAHGPSLVEAFNTLLRQDPMRTEKNEETIARLLEHVERLAVTSWVEVGEEWSLRLTPEQMVRTRALLNECTETFGVRIQGDSGGI